MGGVFLPSKLDNIMRGTPRYSIIVSKQRLYGTPPLDNGCHIIQGWKSPNLMSIICACLIRQPGVWSLSWFCLVHLLEPLGAPALWIGYSQQLAMFAAVSEGASSPQQYCTVLAAWCGFAKMSPWQETLRRPGRHWGHHSPQKKIVHINYVINTLRVISFHSFIE
jgi:hypothetical protein